MEANALAGSAAALLHRNPRRPAVIRWGKKARKRLNRFLSRYSLVPLDPVPDTSFFPWLRSLEAAAPAIQREAAQLLKFIDAIPPMNEMSPDHRRIAGDGVKAEENCARCPETVKALANVPGLVTALISILEPGMHVGRHSGVSKGILIAHLGLRVPRDAHQCWMEVEGQRVEWREGETFVFDDTFKHEVWNRTDEHRVILLVQFERPMRWAGRMVTKLLVHVVRLSPYIRDARANMRDWERKFQRSEAAAAP